MDKEAAEALAKNVYGIGQVHFMSDGQYALQFGTKICHTEDEGHAYLAGYGDGLITSAVEALATSQKRIAEITKVTHRTSRTAFARPRRPNLEIYPHLSSARSNARPCSSVT